MMKLNIQFFGGRGSAGGNAKAAAEKSVAAAAEKNANKTYHVDHTDSAGGEFIDSGTVNGKKIGSRVSLEYGGETRTGEIVGAHKYPNGRVDFTVKMDESRFSRATTKTVGENRLNTEKNNSVKSSIATAERQIKAIDRSLSNGSSMTKMGSGNAGQYIVELGKKDASSRHLVNELKKAGFRQVGNNRWVKNGV